MEEIKKPNILVIGDLMIDHYLWGNVNRISPEAPVQVVEVEKETIVLGGAGNVVNNLVALGADVMVMSVVGEDKNGDEITQMLESIKVKHYLICDENRKTTKKSRIIASHQQVVRYDHESKRRYFRKKSESSYKQQGLLKNNKTKSEVIPGFLN